MDDLIKVGGGVTGTALSAAATAAQTDPVYQIISLVTTIVGLLVTIATTIVIPAIRWYLSARRDGKITPDELHDLSDDLADSLHRTAPPDSRDHHPRR